MSHVHRHLIAASLTLALGLLATWLAYLPGLSGGFLFDDFANLPALGAFGPVDDTITFWRYLTSGHADVTGRPIALLTFLLDARDWPADAYPFKRTNVLLHLLNGALLAWLLAQLGRYLPAIDRAHDGPVGSNVGAVTNFAAVLAACLWMLHPLFVSTTLYVVQREAMLPATFILLGLIGWIALRKRAARGHRTAVLLAVAWLGLTTLLATLSKANGALLPLLTGLVEWLLLSRTAPVIHPRTQRLWRYACGMALLLPTFALIAFLSKTGYSGFVHGLDALRPWTLGERLLTQARVMVDYLGQLWLPRPFSIGLFNDDLVPSSSLLSPPSTLICLLTIVAILVAAWRWRHKYPAAAVAVFFFFAGHLIESTVVALELYFEHRNYLPAMLMFWPLALWLCGPGMRLQRLRRGLAVCLPLALAIMTWLAADLWGNTHVQGLLWAQRNPNSGRAQAYAAQLEMARGQPRAAAARLQSALEHQPKDLQVALNLLGAKCQLGSVDNDDLAAAAHALRTTRNTGRLGYEWFDRGLAIASAGSCNGLDLLAMERLLDAAESNSWSQAVPGRRQDLQHLRGRIALMHGDGDAALKSFDAALLADPRPSAGLQQAALLGAQGYPHQGLAHLQRLEELWRPVHTPRAEMNSIHEWLLWRQGYWRKELARLRKALQEDAKTSGDPSRLPNSKALPDARRQTGHAP